MKLETVRIVAKNKAGFVVINMSDFDASRDKKYVEGQQQPEKVVASRKKTQKPKKASGNKKPNYNLENALNYDADEHADEHANDPDELAEI